MLTDQSKPEQAVLADAARTFFKVLQQDENNVEATFGLGVCFFKQGNRDMARRSFERVLKLQPNHARARENLQVVAPVAKAAPSMAFKLHGFAVELNEGNIYPAIMKANPMFNAPLVQLVHSLGKHLQRPLNFIDVGAACGDTVLLLEQRCAGVVGGYVCIEGDAEFGGFLRRNMAQFKKVRVIESMLAGAKTEVPELVKHHKGSAGCFGEKKVQARPLDDIMADEAFKPDLLKIDVDGFDGEVIRGATHLLRRDQPAVIFEWHPKLYADAGQDYKTPFQILAECGYGPFAWFDNCGEFSHFSSTADFNIISPLRDFLLAVNVRRDQHFDVMAFPAQGCPDLVSLAALEYARGAMARHPAV
jgi:FkbM family methyltransferase